MLPRAVALDEGVTLQVIDYVVTALQATADTTGTATITYDEVPTGYLWRVERIVITSDATGQLTCSVYAGSSVLPQYLRDFTLIPPGFAAIGEYPQPLTVESSTSLVIVAAGAAAGDVVTVSVQYALVQRAEG